MARWAASAEWGEAPALDGQCATLLGLALSEGLGLTALALKYAAQILDDNALIRRIVFRRDRC